MRLTLQEYWEQHLTALKKRSVKVTPDPDKTEMVFARPGNPYAGIVDATVWFDDQAHLDVYEHVEIDGASKPHRTKYSYHLIIDGSEAGREDFDARIRPKELRHHSHYLIGGEWNRSPSERISLATFVDYAWALIQDFRSKMSD